MKDRQKMIEKIIEQVTAQIKKDKAIKGILLFGSCARDLDSLHNDVDLYVITNLEKVKRKIFYFQDTLIDVFYNSIQGVKLRFQKEEWLTTIRIFLEGKIVDDSKQIVENLQKEALLVFQKRKNPSMAEKSKFRYLVTDLLADLENEIKKDKVQALYLMNILLSLIIKIHYRIIEKIPPKENYVLKDIQELDVNLHKEISKFLLARELHIKQKLIKKLAQKILEPIGGICIADLEF